MEIGGLQKFTLIDYPSKVAATVFTLGCNFRCPFCYSGELVIPEKVKKQPRMKESVFFNFLKKRKGKLDGVVICGGEPTIHSDLPSFVEKIKKLGFLVKLDTNGSHPSVLKEMVKENLLDYIAMDIKAPKEKYSPVFKDEDDIEKIKESISFLKEGKVTYEFRTTVVPNFIDKEDVIKIAEWISPASKYYLQDFKAEKTIDSKFEDVNPYGKEYLKEIKEEIESKFEKCEIRI